jgi:hypothetical protein
MRSVKNEDRMNALYTYDFNFIQKRTHKHGYTKGGRQGRTRNNGTAEEKATRRRQSPKTQAFFTSTIAAAY